MQTCTNKDEYSRSANQKINSVWLAKNTAWWNDSSFLNKEKETRPPDVFTAPDEAKSELKKKQEHYSEYYFPAKPLVGWQTQIDLWTGTNWSEWNDG